MKKAVYRWLNASFVMKFSVPLGKGRSVVGEVWQIFLKNRDELRFVLLENKELETWSNSSKYVNYMLYSRILA